MFFSRGKNKIQSDYATKDGYEFYIEGIEPKSIYDIPVKQYVGICKTFNDKLMRAFLDKGGEVKFPCGLGSLMIGVRETPYGDLDRMPIDWKSTNEKGKLIYHLNEHSNGKRYTINWVKHYNRGSDYHMFKIKRDWLRYLAAKVKSGTTMYG